MPRLPFCLIAVAFAFLTPAFADTLSRETIVLLRHGEKPKGGLGQLACQGMNGQPSACPR